MICDLIVELVSPLLIGGADGGSDDPATLRPPSVRGQLRFWARAVGGESLANRLWGDVKSGQRVRIVGAQSLGNTKNSPLFPDRRGGAGCPSDMVPPGTRSRIRFAVPDSVSLEQLQANVWLWLHLGTLGRRSQRGYGSLVWEPHDGDLLDGFLDPPDLTDGALLGEYLEKGLQRVFEVLGVQLQERRSSSDERFKLDSLDQIFVGKVPAGSAWRITEASEQATQSLEYLCRGFKPRYGEQPPDCDQLGQAAPRLPSPMLWRFFSRAGGGHIPVMTWSPYGYGDQYPQIAQRWHEMVKYLQALGFSESLSGGKLFS